ncbi:SAM-dependent methyltransferase [Thermopolyspora sp. NPDC052614]|uniref:SAM-dependent methyltransferase n=1 Tax=Thermopolyspora sp. NPDC052614 TaxID=3155682 RepID=UPI00343F5A01
MTEDFPPNSDSPSLDTHIAHSARVWNYILGGKDNYPADREAGDLILKMFPDFARIARLQRYFLHRAVRFLTAEAGIRQFLDIGTGLPTHDNTHEVAQRIAPSSRIVYVDNDPIVLIHARALLTSAPEGVTDYIDADVRDPERILEHAAHTLDFTKPVALMMLGILGQLSDDDDPAGIINRLLADLPSGSYLALSDGINTNQALNAAIAAYNTRSANTYHVRTPQQIASFFNGLELVEPGVVVTSRWRPDLADLTPAPEPEEASMCGVARKP